MRVVIRFYKRSDLDLIALQKHEISLSKMAKQVVEAFANGTRVHYLLPELHSVSLDDLDWFKLNIKDGLRTEFTTHDPETINLLKSVKGTYRNLFIKTLLRNSLYEQSLNVFFNSKTLIERENSFIKSVDTERIPNYQPLLMVGAKNYKAEDFLISPEERKKRSKEKKESRGSEEYLKEKHIIKEKDEKKASDTSEMDKFLKNEPIGEISEISEVKNQDTGDDGGGSLSEADQEAMDAIFSNLIDEI